MNNHILIVDDEVNIRLMLRTILETSGYVVSEASNGREALEVIRGGSFDLVVLDLNMPVIDGMTVLGQLQKTPASHNPRIVVLTAYGSISAAVKATRLGALDFIEKPASPEEVRDVVAAALSEPSPAQGLDTVNVSAGYEGVLDRARRALRVADFTSAESMLMKAADLAEKDAAYFNMLGVLYEVRRQWPLARKFYGKAIRADRHYEPAQTNMRRIYELYTFGRSMNPVMLGDEPGTVPSRYSVQSDTKKDGVPR